MLTPDTTTHWLRVALAQADPRVTLLRTKLGAPEAGAWFANAMRGVATDAAAQLLQSVRTTTDSGVAEAAAFPIDPPLRDEVLGVVAELGPEEAARWACVELCAHELAAPPATARTSGGRTVGHYRLEHPIGHGASSSVFRAYHLDNGLPAAVKLLRIEAADAEQVLRFRQEAQITAKLRHPAIVQLLDSGVDSRDGIAIPYLVSELIDGRPFALALRGSSPTRIATAAIELAEAIAHAHRCGVLHRDLKSANVLIDGDGRVHVLDFGIARVREQHGLLHTSTGQVLGSPETMSPEQAAGRALDERSDLWSLGAMVFEALTGTVPFDLRGLGGAAVLRRIAESEPRRLDRLRPDLDPDLVAIVHKAIATAPDDRYRSVDALVSDLSAWLAGDAVTARAPGLWRSARKLARRHRLATAALLTTLGAIGGGGGIALWQWQEARHSAQKERESAQKARESAQKAQQAVLQALEMMEQMLMTHARLAETISDIANQRRSLDQALALLPKVDTSSSKEADRRDAIEARLREIAGDLATRDGDLIGAERQFRAMLELLRRLTDTRSRGVADLVRAFVKVGDCLRTHNQAEALAYYQTAHQLLVEATADASAPIELVDDVGWSYQRLAGCSMMVGDHDRACGYAAEFVAHAERLLSMRDDAMRHFGLSSALTMLRSCRDEAGYPVDAAAVATLERALREADEAVRREPERRAFVQRAVSVRLALVHDSILDPSLAHSLCIAGVQLVNDWLRRDPNDVEAQLHCAALLVLAARSGPAPDSAHLVAEQEGLWATAIRHAERAAESLGWSPRARLTVLDAHWGAWKLASTAGLPTAAVLQRAIDSQLEVVVERSDVTVGELAHYAAWLGHSGPPSARDQARALRLLRRALAAAVDAAITTGVRDSMMTTARELGIADEAAASLARIRPRVGGARR